jgi:hypothetical protein
MYNQEREDMACLDEHEAINLKALVGGGALKAHTVQRPWLGRGQSPFQRPPYERWTGSYLHKSRDFTKLDALST